MVRQVPVHECLCDHCGRVGGHAASPEVAVVLALRSGFSVQSMGHMTAALLCPACAPLAAPVGRA